MSSMVSVIIPVYKSKDTITACVESVINQTYKDFEIIMIDDGSPDNSGQICDELCSKFNSEGYRLRVLHQENGGVSAARNRGMEAAEGEYFVCVDSDDTVSETYLQDMVELQESDGSFGSVHCALRSMYVTGLAYVFSEEEEISVCDRKDYMAVFNKNIAQSPCLHLYRTEVVRKNKLRMREDLSNGEDLIFNLQYFDALDNTKFGIVNKANYLYNDGGDSLNWGYRPNLYRDYNEINSAIKKYLIKWGAFSGSSRTSYYNTAFYHYTRVLENTFNKNNSLGLIQKIRFNNSVLRTDEFKETLENCSSCPRGIIKAAYRSGHYVFVPIAKQIRRLFGRIKRLFKR